jgi:hypothetical protein
MADAALAAGLVPYVARAVAWVSTAVPHLSLGSAFWWVEHDWYMVAAEAALILADLAAYLLSLVLVQLQVLEGSATVVSPYPGLYCSDG